MKTPRLGFAALSLAMLLLSGCAGPSSAGGGDPAAAAPDSSELSTAPAAPSDTPSDTSGETPSETTGEPASEPPSETPVATGTPAPAPSEGGAAQITDTGVGDLVVGKPVAGGAFVAWDADACWDGRGAYVADGDDAVGAKSFATTTVDYKKSSPVDNIIVYSPSISTAEGIHPGSTRAELEAAYPDFSAVYKTDKRDLTTDLYVLENDVAQTVFEVVHAGSGDGFNPAIKDETVAWIIVEDASHKAHSIAGGDAAGPCPG